MKKVRCFLLAAVCAACMAAPLTGCDDGGGGGRVGGTCMVDGCNRPAVGPTYEFCALHKKSLDDYWAAGGD